ncbi:MAG: DUF499 domain-containing protein [Candidatus Poribacteria bacterium]|nr:DUF499 domain-containing protein [Candidatus Poribacteria bacterium]
MRLPPFETIAKPHSDIRTGNFTADAYAARLGQVVNNQGSREYRNPQQFFERTHITDGLKTLLSGVEGRLKGRNRQNKDPIIRLQTPFGGGKTHTLIALYHKTKEWNALPVVMVGSAMDPGHGDTFWGAIERQLTGNLQHFTMQVAPGSDSLADIFDRTQKPVLILMDEVLNYLERAAGVSVYESTLAEQTIAFMLSLTEAVASNKRITFVATLQESEIAPIIEKFPLFTELLARMRRVVTPVEETEIASIIRKRLFAEANSNEVKRITQEFAKYARQENILPPGIQESEYRKQFMESYPFQPEVIDVLYKRWGSFPNFQRTRGVLRFLSRVVHRASGKNRPYITLADFDLTDSDIRGELLEHIDAPYRGIINNDITGRTAGAKAVDKTSGGTYQHLALGTRTATAIFLYSFTGGMERGATLEEIKRSAAVLEHPAAIIDTAKHQLTEHLFYLRTKNRKTYFDTQPNLNRIVQTRMENVDPEVVKARVAAQLRISFKAGREARLKIHCLPKDSMAVPDDETLKLIVLDRRDDAFCQDLIENRGETRRIYRNTLFFILPATGEATELKAETRKIIAYEEIKKDTSLNLSKEQKREVDDALKQSNSSLEGALRQDYRTVLVPQKDGFTEEDLGPRVVGMTPPFDEEVYDLLCVKNAIATNLGPQNIAIAYLQNNDTVSTVQLLNTSLRTPGEKRVQRHTWIEGIRRGIETGIFGIGERAADKLVPRAFNTALPEVTLTDAEVIIQPNLARESITPEEILHDYLKENETISTSLPFQYNPQSTNEPRPLRDIWESAICEGVRQGTFGIGDKIDDKPVLRAFREEVSTITLGDSEVLIDPSISTSLIVERPDPDPLDDSESVDPPDDGTDNSLPDGESKKTISIRFRLPQGKVSSVVQHLNELQSNFQNMQLELKASDGKISQDAYDEFKENLRELGIEIEEV